MMLRREVGIGPWKQPVYLAIRTHLRTHLRTRIRTPLAGLLILRPEREAATQEEEVCSGMEAKEMMIQSVSGSFSEREQA